jgi:hypothetical protein
MSTTPHHSPDKNTRSNSQSLAAALGILFLGAAATLGISPVVELIANAGATSRLAIESELDRTMTYEAVNSIPQRRTALFNAELDSLTSSTLLWVFYLSLPVSVVVAIWRYDQRSREQMATLLQQMATLERIWQSPQVWED